METSTQTSNPVLNENSRRQFIKTSLKISIATGISGIGVLSGCKSDGEKEVTPPEDLMQEHGLLNRILLIYDHCKTQLINNQKFSGEALHDAANIIRIFIENYHEKQEEQYIFPRLKKANKQVELVNILLDQHQAGRRITAQLLQLTKYANTDKENQRITQLLTAFNFMYRPHEAREDTILFPAFRKIVSQHEYDSLGEEFEKNEHNLFGKDGFDVMVSKVAGIENLLGIYDLSQFTPQEP